MPAHKPAGSKAFTMVELMVSIVVLVLVLLLVSRMFDVTSMVAGLGSKQMDADAQARTLFDRMAIDFGQMVRRQDVDYFLKDADTNNKQPGNDQLAFYSEVPGYPVGSGQPQSPVSLVAYRVKDGLTQRLGKGLLWSAPAPDGVLYSPKSISYHDTTQTPPVYSTIVTHWPEATDATDDPNYEVVGSHVFRMEYCYLLKGRNLPTGASLSSQLSAVPWDQRITGIPGLVNHTYANGLEDVAAIVVAVAIIDPKSKTNVTDAQLQSLSSSMPDLATSLTDMTGQWRTAIDNSGIPKIHAAGIRIYTRYFYLPPNHTPIAH